MKKMFFISLSLCFVFVSSSFAANLNLEQLLDKVQANQNKIQDMYAETTTTITSDMAMPGSTQKGPQKMVQKGKMWTKGKDKSKIEMISPTKQITITNGDQMAIINPQTGQKIVQDLSKLNGPTQSSKNMDLQKAMEYFDLSVKQADDGDYVITGIPKKDNKFLTKMEFHIDTARWVPTRVLMYSGADKLMSQSKIEYQSFEINKNDQAYLPVKNVSNVNTPMGRMEIEMIFENIKVNKGMKDGEFEVK